jgi:hypothetical protein
MNSLKKYMGLVFDMHGSNSFGMADTKNLHFFNLGVCIQRPKSVHQFVIELYQNSHVVLCVYSLQFFSPGPLGDFFRGIQFHP